MSMHLTVSIAACSMLLKRGLVSNKFLLLYLALFLDRECQSCSSFKQFFAWILIYRITVKTMDECYATDEQIYATPSNVYTITAQKIN